MVGDEADDAGITGLKHPVDLLILLMELLNKRVDDDLYGVLAVSIGANALPSTRRGDASSQPNATMRPLRSPLVKSLCRPRRSPTRLRDVARYEGFRSPFELGRADLARRKFIVERDLPKVGALERKQLQEAAQKSNGAFDVGYPLNDFHPEAAGSLLLKGEGQGDPRAALADPVPEMGQPRPSRFRTIQVCPKDLRAALRQAGDARMMALGIQDDGAGNKWRYGRVCSADGIALSGGFHGFRELLRRLRC
jgi:hypothetical protein